MGGLKALANKTLEPASAAAALAAQGQRRWTKPLRGSCSWPVVPVEPSTFSSSPLIRLARTVFLG